MTLTPVTFTVGDKSITMAFDESRHTQKWIYDILASGSLYEEGTVRAMQRILKPGDTFIDVGAHVGYFSVVAGALVGPSGFVKSFEPDGDNFRFLDGNLLFLDFQKHVQGAAVGHRTGTVDFWVNIDADGGHALWDVGEHPMNVKSKATPKKIKVPIVRLDEFGYLRPALIKIDTEGCELRVLSGAREMLKANPDCSVICEINRYALAQMGCTEEMLRVFMEKEMGYRCFLLEDFPCDGAQKKKEPELMPFGYTVDSINVFNVLFAK